MAREYTDGLFHRQANCFSLKPLALVKKSQTEKLCVTVRLARPPDAKKTSVNMSA
jgi:hypothetical protein